MHKILCISTAGKGQDPLRVRRLCEGLEASCAYYDLDPSASVRENAIACWRRLHSREWDLIYMEGTGLAGGLPLIIASYTNDSRFVVSSGDPVGGFFRTVKGPAWGFLFERYERLLYRRSAGFIGWTPYLTGAAMKMGAPRAVTVEGAVDLSIFTPCTPSRRRALKRKYGLHPDHLVCGVVGSLNWTPRQQYCYGLELVEMLKHTQRDDVSILIVGDGSGKKQLESRVPPSIRHRVSFTGRVPEKEVVDTLNAMDVGFITQTMDSLGRYRLTTKLPEYLASGLPVAMSPIPGFYDYVRDAGWSLPAHHPASPSFHHACAAWIDRLDESEIEERRARAPKVAEKFFSYEKVRPKFSAFISDLLMTQVKHPRARFEHL